MEGMGERKLSFPFFKIAKRWNGPLGRSVSTYFVADFSLLRVLFGDILTFTLTHILNSIN